MRVWSVDVLSIIPTLSAAVPVPGNNLKRCGTLIQVPLYTTVSHEAHDSVACLEGFIFISARLQSQCTEAVDLRIRFLFMPLSQHFHQLFLDLYHENL